MKRVLLLGASGMLGCSLAPFLRSKGHNVIRQSRADGYDIKLDPLDHLAFEACLRQVQPDAVVNLVAATNVDQCEENPQWAFDANVGPILALQRATSSANIYPHIVHISTDQLYSGTGPHSEDNVRPSNVYSLSKLAAEFALKGYPSTIFRTNFFGLSRAQGRSSFSDWIVESIKADRPIVLFDDVLFSALHLETLCDFINLAIVRGLLGTFNVGSSDGISKAQFALQLAMQLGLDTSNITVGSVKQVDLKACRPLDMRMNTSLFQQRFDICAPTSTIEITKTANEYNVYA